MTSPDRSNPKVVVSRPEQSDKLSELTKAHEARLSDALAGPTENLFENADDETWSSIRNLLRRETECAFSGFSDALSDFKIDEPVRKKMLANLQEHAKGVVETKAKEGAKTVSKLVMERFSKLFLYDSNSNPRTWTIDDDIEAISTDAYSAASKLLSAMSVVRLDERADDTENVRSRILGTPAEGTSLREKILLTPAELTSLWEQFMKETQGIVNLAISTQEKNKGNGDWL